MHTDGSNTGTRPPTASNTTEADRFTTESVDGTPATVVRRQTEASDAFDAITTVLDRTPDVELDPDPTVQSLAHADETVGYRITYETTSERATDVVATRFDDDEDDEPLVSAAIDGGDGGPVRYYYRANADTVDGDDRNVSVQREPLAPYTSDEPTVDGPVPLPRSVTARLDLLSTEPRVDEKATVTARNSSAQGTFRDSSQPVRIVKYEWDLDGDGTYEHEPAVSGNIGDATLDLPKDGTYHDPVDEFVQVRVHGSNGETDTAGLEFTVRGAESPEAVITEKEPPERIGRNLPGTYLLSAEDTKNLRNVDTIEWNFAYQGGQNSGKIHGEPDDSKFVTERPSNGWTEPQSSQIYEYQIEGTYTVRLKVTGDDTVSTTTTELEVTDTGYEQVRGDIVKDAIPDADNPIDLDGVRYVVKNAEVLTQSGWEPYDGEYTWLEDGNAVSTTESNAYHVQKSPYAELELGVELSVGQRSEIISTHIEPSEEPLRTNILPNAAGNNEVSFHRADTEYWTDNEWKPVVADTYEWFGEYGRRISTGEQVQADSANGFKLEVTYDDFTATATYNYDESTTSGDLIESVEPRIERKLDKETIQNTVTAPDSGIPDRLDDEAVRAMGGGLSYQSGPLMVPPDQTVTISAERSTIPGDVDVNDFQWLLYRELESFPNSVQYVTSFSGSQFEWEFANPGVTVEAPAEDTDDTSREFTASGRAHVVLKIDTTEGWAQRVTTVYASSPSAPDRPSNDIIGYEPDSGHQEPVSTAATPVIDDSYDVDATVTGSVRTTDSPVQRLRLVDDAHPGRSVVLRERE